MRLEHVALYVVDLKKMRDFYVRYFGAVSNGGYHNKRTGFQSYFLSFSDGCRIEIMSRPEVTGQQALCYSKGYAHIALCVDSKEQVDELTRRLKNDGYEILSDPRTTGDGYYESAIADPEGNYVEITVEKDVN